MTMPGQPSGRPGRRERGDTAWAAVPADEGPLTRPGESHLADDHLSPSSRHELETLLLRQGAGL